MPPPIEPAEAPRTLSSTPSPTVDKPEAQKPETSPRTSGASTGNPVADAFSALLAVELGEPGARPVRLVSGSQEPAVTDAMVDEVTRRVLERLGPEAVKGVVADIVSEVAERLVRL
jgi:hypothetical protein